MEVQFVFSFVDDLTIVGWDLKTKTLFLNMVINS